MTKSPHHDESAPMSDPNGGGNRECCEKCKCKCIVPSGNKIDCFNPDCPCHRTTSPLEEILKERREAFERLFYNENKYSSASQFNSYLVGRLPSAFQTFLSESIRIAYEAGCERDDIVDMLNYGEAKKEGYRAGLERAKALVFQDDTECIHGFNPGDDCPNNHCDYKYYRKVYSRLDDEIKNE